MKLHSKKHHHTKRVKSIPLHSQVLCGLLAHSVLAVINNVTDTYH